MSWFKDVHASYLQHHFPHSTLFPSSRWKAPLAVITTDYVRNTAPATDQNAVLLRNKFYTTSRSTFPGLNDNYDANKIHIIHNETVTPESMIVTLNNFIFMLRMCKCKFWWQDFQSSHTFKVKFHDYLEY